MWCAKCQADVSSEVSADGQTINCTSCGSEIRRTQAPSLHPEIRRARQLIEQLSSADTEQVNEDQKSKLEKPRADTQGETTPVKPRTAAPYNPIRSLRVDGPHPAERGSHAPPPDNTVAVMDSAAAGPERRDDDAHPTLAAPHFDLAALPRKPNPGKAESIWGQLLAYGGVAVLTVGTALVLWGHFGGPPEYAPTGWLVATAGQMLLLLGVVTLISGGMQQTTHQVTARVEFIGSRMHRFEQTAEQLLRGPHFGGDGQSSRKTHRDDDRSKTASS